MPLDRPPDNLQGWSIQQLLERSQGECSAPSQTATNADEGSAAPSIDLNSVSEETIAGVQGLLCGCASVLALRAWQGCERLWDCYISQAFRKKRALCRNLRCVPQSAAPLLVSFFGDQHAYVSDF